VTLACPDTGNRITQAMAEELRQVCRQLREQDHIHLAVLTGSGNSFSVGREEAPQKAGSGPAPARDAWMEQRRVAGAVAALPMPVVAVLNGDALDHGLELALAADLRVASASAMLGITDLAAGRFPWDGGIQRLARLAGLAWARDMVLTGRVVSAQEALELGLVNRVAANDSVEVEMEALARQMLAAGPIAARYVKEAIVQGADLTLPQALRLEADLSVILQTTTDRAEGIQSFKERRKPRFTNR